MPLAAERPYSMAAVPMPNRRNQKACSRFLQACTQRVRVFNQAFSFGHRLREILKPPYIIFLLTKKREIWLTVSDWVKHSWSQKTTFIDVTKTKAWCMSSIFIFAPQMGGKVIIVIHSRFSLQDFFLQWGISLVLVHCCPQKKGLTSRFCRIWDLSEYFKQDSGVNCFQN